MLSKKSQPSRITVTEIGRKKQREMLQDLTLDTPTLVLPPRKRASNLPSPFYIGDPTSNRGSNQGTNSRDILHLSLDGPNSSLHINNSSFQSRRKDTEHLKLPKLDLKPELEQNSFLKRKFDKLNQLISKIESRHERAHRMSFDSSSYTPYVNGLDSSHLLSNMHDQSIHNRSGGDIDMNDKFMVKQVVKLLHTESEAEVLMMRHKKNLELMEKIRGNIAKKNEKRKSFGEEGHKPPNLVDCIKKTDPEAIEALQRNTNYMYRRKIRIKERLRDKYQGFWNQFQDIKQKK